MGSSTVIIVDCLDPRLRFSHNWASSRTPGRSARTAYTTLTAGSSLTFTFNGTSVAVYGTVETTSRSGLPPESTYCLDDGPVMTFKVTPSDNVHRVLYATSLAETEHTLVVTGVADSATFWVDYISYVPIAISRHEKRVGFLLDGGLDTETPTPSPSPSTINSSVNTLLTSSSDIPSSITFTTPPSSSASSASDQTTYYASHTRVKVIAGGVVGGVVLLAVALTAYYWFGHRITHTRSASSSRERKRGQRLSIEPGMRSPASGGSKHPTSSITPFQYQNPASVGDSDTNASAADLDQTSPTVEDIEGTVISSHSSIRPLPLLPPPSSTVNMQSSLRPGSSSGSTLSGHGSIRRELPRRPLPLTPLPRQISARSSRPRTAPKKDPPVHKITRPQTAPQYDPPPAYEWTR